MSNSTATLSSTWPYAPAWLTRCLQPPAAIAGYLAGFSVLPNEWFHLGWLLLVGCLALGSVEGRRLWRWPVSAGPGLIAAFILWMTLRSCYSEVFFSGHATHEAFRGLLGAVLLALFCILLWQVAREDDRTLRLLGWITGLAALVAALASLITLYGVMPAHHVAGERLTNVLVHGGLNSVCTGMIFGFAALWFVVLVEKTSVPSSRGWVWSAITLLHLAAFLTGSRGVMLALACGHAALFFSHGWRRSVPALLVLIFTGTVYFTSAPLWAQLTAWRKPAVAAAESVTSSTSGMVQHWEAAVARGDNGRLNIYRAGWRIVDNVWIGTGQWGMRDAWQCDLQPNACMMSIHLHSGFFVTLVHGGLIGAVLLLALLARASHAAWCLACQGDATWLVLLAFGCGGLLFDGESLASLATAPRFEGLLFWLPVVVALAKVSVTLSRAASGNLPRHQTPAG